MHKPMYSETSVFGLIRELREEIKIFVQQEIQLAKTEISEKISCFGRNAVALGIGGFIAYAGLMVLLAAFGSLLAYVFEKTGMERTMAGFLGLGIVGLVVALVGFAFIMKALNAFKGASLAPEKTLQTLKELKPGETVPEPKQTKTEHKPSSDELESEVDVTITRMEETTEEIRERFTPRYMRHALVQKIKTHPVISGSIGAGAGLLGCLLVWRKIRHARS